MPPNSFQMPAAGSSRGPVISLSAISDAWRTYSPDLVGWIARVLIFLVIGGVGFGVLMAAGIFSLSSAAEGKSGGILYVLAVSVLSPFLNLLTIGLLRCGLIAVRGAKPAIGDMFDLEGRGKPVLIFLFIMQCLSLPYLLISWLAPLLGLGLGLLFQILFAIAWMLLLFAPFLIFDQGKQPVDAIKESFGVLSKQFLMLLVLMICTGIVGEIGAFACGIGVLFTLPFMFVVPAIVYNDFYPVQPAAPQPGQFTEYPRQ